MSAGGVKSLVKWAAGIIGGLILATVTGVVTQTGPWFIHQLHDFVWGPGPLVTVHREPLWDSDDPPKGDIAWKLVVPDPHAVPPGPSVSPPQSPPGKDCADLWRTGVNANGQPPTTPNYKVTVWGNADVTIIDLRAEILNRFPPSGGAIFMCIPTILGNPVSDEPTSCDLTQQLDNRKYAPCAVKDAAGQVVLLRDSKTISLHKGGDPTTLQVNMKLPDDAVEWKLEAHVTTPSGDDQWVDIGSSVRSAGLRQMNAGQFYDQYIMAFLYGVIRWKPGDPTTPPTIPPSAPSHP
jgi:hypothetical protein